MNCIKRLCKNENSNKNLIMLSNEDFNYSFTKVFSSVSRKDQKKYENVRNYLKLVTKSYFKEFNTFRLLSLIFADRIVLFTK